MGQSNSSQKIERTDKELLQALQRHVRLLRAYCERGIDDREDDYLGEIAAKIRLLVWKGNHNKPLLLNLMRRFEQEIRSAPGQWSPEAITHFMNEMAYRLPLPSGEERRVSRIDLIRTWAEQHGAAHEDWEIDEHFVYAMESVIVVGGCTQLMGLLDEIANDILWAAEQFLDRLRKARPDLFEPEAREPRPGAPHLIRTV